MGPTALACEQRTSFASISRFGIDSALGPLGEDEVAVGLGRVGVLGVVAEAHQPAVDRAGLVLDGALEQQVAAGVGRRVVLEGAEVEHLVPVAEVDGEEVALRPGAGEQRFGAHAGVVAAERDGRGAQRRVAADVGALQADLPGRAGRAPAPTRSGPGRRRRR